jgi:hypothetical protein
MQRQGKKVDVEVPKTTKDLSMSDRAPFALFEYSVSFSLLLGPPRGNQFFETQGDTGRELERRSVPVLKIVTRQIQFILEDKAKGNQRPQPRKVTLRQTGTIELKHAGPATRLQMPFVRSVSACHRKVADFLSLCPPV